MRILLDPSTANTFLIPNIILWIHITGSNVRQDLLLFSAESFVFQFAIQKVKDQDI